MEGMEGLNGNLRDGVLVDLVVEERGTSRSLVVVVVVVVDVLEVTPIAVVAIALCIV